MNISTRTERLREFQSSDVGLTFLLISLVSLIFVIYPFFRPEGLGAILIDLFMTFTLVSGALVPWSL